MNGYNPSPLLKTIGLELRNYKIKSLKEDKPS
jgi:hypothetical protein